ncbi:hypothetical protein LguiA_017321 [Lonicera macranthoides]
MLLIPIAPFDPIPAESIVLASCKTDREKDLSKCVAEFFVLFEPFADDIKNAYNFSAYQNNHSTLALFFNNNYNTKQLLSKCIVEFFVLFEPFADDIKHAYSFSSN